MKTKRFSREWAHEIMKMHRRILSAHGRGLFPEMVTDQIADALCDPARSLDMLLQLLVLCDVGPRDRWGHFRIVNGQLFYTDAETYVVFGTNVYRPSTDWRILQEIPIVIADGKPCFVERSEQEERVRWGEQGGTSYSRGSISDLREANGKPCFLVNVYDGSNGTEWGHLVLDEFAGPRFERVRDLVVVDDKPTYVGHIAYGNEALMWGDVEITRSNHVSRPVTVDNKPCAAVRPRADSRERELWLGRERIVGPVMLEGPAVLGGQLAYVTERKGRVEVFRGSECVDSAGGRLLNWWVPNHSDTTFVVYVVRGVDNANAEVRALGVNGEPKLLCTEKMPEPNGLFLDHDDITLRVRLEGERQTRVFNLVELGIIP